MNLDEVNDSIVAFHNDCLRREHVRLLPKVYLESLEGCRLERIWDILPEAYQQNEEFQKRKPCRQPWNQPWQRIHIDGPPPPVYRCVQCKKSEINKGVNDEECSVRL